MIFCRLFPSSVCPCHPHHRIRHLHPLFETLQFFLLERSVSTPPPLVSGLALTNGCSLRLLLQETSSGSLAGLATGSSHLFLVFCQSATSRVSPGDSFISGALRKPSVCQVFGQVGDGAWFSCPWELPSLRPRSLQETLTPSRTSTHQPRLWLCPALVLSAWVRPSESSCRRSRP